MRLRIARNRLYLFYDETENHFNASKLSPETCELRNLNTISYLVMKGGQKRKECRGVDDNTDEPIEVTLYFRS